MSHVRHTCVCSSNVTCQSNVYNNSSCSTWSHRTYYEQNGDCLSHDSRLSDFYRLGFCLYRTKSILVTVIVNLAFASVRNTALTRQTLKTFTHRRLASTLSAKNELNVSASDVNRWRLSITITTGDNDVKPEAETAAFSWLPEVVAVSATSELTIFDKYWRSSLFDLWSTQNVSTAETSSCRPDLSVEQVSFTSVSRSSWCSKVRKWREMN